MEPASAEPVTKVSSIFTMFTKGAVGAVTSAVTVTVAVKLTLFAGCLAMIVSVLPTV
ncbi:hypothetical protein D3C73_709080 [compost metagenome]